MQLLDDNAVGSALPKDGEVKCTLCNQPMHLLLQLNAPLDELDRTLYVFGCNQPSCHTSTSTETMLGGGGNRFRPCFGGGSVRCFRSQQPWKTSGGVDIKPSVEKVPPKVSQLEDNDWGDDDDDDWGDATCDDDDEWGASATISTKAKSQDITMDDLEAMISKCEMQSASKSKVKASSTKTASNNKQTVKVTSTAPSFCRYDLEMINEPCSKRINSNDSDDDDDDDDIDAGGANNTESKVNQLLSRYLSTEDDEEILSALKGGDISYSGGGGGDKGGERYERLPPEERAFVSFSKRLKRAPEQVARYAYGGVPLWSM